MKISYNWLKTIININLDEAEVARLLTGCGLEVEGWETVSTVKGGLEGIVIGEVKEKWQHPNADRLSVTKVDVGGPELLQIVCGAANVAAGQKVPVALVGATLYPIKGEPFKISKSKLRGEVSEGMICAEDEIGLGESHDGIMVLDANTKVGTPAAEYFKVETDTVFEIGLTANRGDAASHLGVARDLAALTGAKISVEYKDIDTSKAADNYTIQLDDAEACPRYSGVAVSGITVKESPAWLQNRLKAIGLNPINNVVDVTNYVLHELGQPIHAFDADKVKGKKIIVKKAKAGEKFTTLDKVERTLTGHELLICNADEPMALAGVFGGLESGVTADTKNIFIESAYFNPATIRKSAKTHGLSTDASFRYERGTDPDITVNALKRVVQLILENAGGTVTSAIADAYPQPLEPLEIPLRYEKVAQVLGISIPKEKIKTILESLDIRVKSEYEKGIMVQVPRYRMDVTREIDVIEEIIRIYGLNNIETPEFTRLPLIYGHKDDDKVYNRIADMLSAQCFNEIATNSLTKVSYYTEEELKSAVRMMNPLSADLEVMRMNMLYSGLEAIAYNRNRKANNLKFFELGKTYSKSEGKYIEKQHLALFVCGDEKDENWKYKAEPIGFDFIKQSVDNIFGLLGIKTDGGDMAILTNSYQDDSKLISFCNVPAKVLKQFDINTIVYFAVIDWEETLKRVHGRSFSIKEVSKFPEVRRDLSLVVDKKTTFEELRKIALQAEKKLIRNINVFDVYEGDRIEQGKKAYAVSFTLQDENKTLTDSEIDALMQKLIHIFEKQAGAYIRK